MICFTIFQLVSFAASKCGYEACEPVKNGVVNVHLVPHTHDDTGWEKTLGQYYYGSANSIPGLSFWGGHHSGVQYIIDTVIEELQKNPKRKFVWVELAFFWRWYNSASITQKNQV